MPGYNVYVSDKSNPELIAAFAQMKSDGMLSEFIIESCEASLPLFLERRIAESQTRKEWYEGLRDNYQTTKDRTHITKTVKRREYLEVVPRDKSRQELKEWLTSPASTEKWRAAGFRNAQEVIDAVQKETSQLSPEPSPTDEAGAGIDNKEETEETPTKTKEQQRQEYLETLTEHAGERSNLELQNWLGGRAEELSALGSSVKEAAEYIRDKENAVHARRRAATAMAPSVVMGKPVTTHGG